MYFNLEIHQVSKEVSFFILFYVVSYDCTQHNHSNYKFYSSFTKLNLAKSQMLKHKILLKLSMLFKIVESTDPVVKLGLADHHHHNRKNLSDSRQLTTSFLTQ